MFRLTVDTTRLTLDMLWRSLIINDSFPFQLVELKNGETYNGHLVSCDNWMNINLREVICTSRVSHFCIRCILLVVVHVIPLFLVRRSSLSINMMCCCDVIVGILLKVSFLGHLQ